MRIFRVWTLVALSLLAVPAAQAQEEPYRLGPQDRVRIHVHEWPALTGDFTVGAMGTIALPVIGEVEASGLIPKELGMAIGERLQKRARLSEPPSSVVDIIQYRPFYIVGGVARPGEFVYRPGMMVLNAVSLAGGFYRSERSTEWGLERDVITSLGSLNEAASRKAELQAREIRLRAEATDTEEMPPAPKDADEELITYYQQEQLIFDARLARHKNQIKQLKQDIRLGEEEIEAVRAQIVEARKQFESADKELKDHQGYVSRGITQATRLLPLERAVAQISREMRELDASIVRARQSMNRSEREIADLIDARKATAAEELQTLQTRLEEAVRNEETASRMITGARSAVSSSRRRAANPEQITVRYYIVREIDGKTREIDAEETTRVLPGDIIKVMRSRDIRESARAQSSNRTSVGSIAKSEDRE